MSPQAPLSVLVSPMTICNYILAFTNTILTNFIYGKASHAIRSALADQFLRIGYPFFLQQSPGRLLNIISNESWRASDAMQNVLAATVNASAAVILLGLLLLLSWQMALCVALGLVLVQLAHAILSASLKNLEPHCHIAPQRTCRQGASPRPRRTADPFVRVGATRKGGL